MKKVVLFFSLIVGLLASATLQAQVNMNRYITLTVKSGEAIKLNFRADAAATPVRIVSGSNTQNITVSTDWYNSSNPSTFTVTAAASTMTVYGDLMGFNCSDNGANLTALDVSHNTQLEWLNCGNNRLTTLDVSHNTQLEWLNCGNNRLTTLDVSHNTQLDGLGCGNNRLTTLDVSHNTQLTYFGCRSNQLTSLDVSQNTQLTELDCYYNQISSLDVSKNTKLKWLVCYDNNFSTQALDDIYCALPDRKGKDNGVIQPVFNSSSLDHATVKATNKANATAKNWKVQYWQGYIDIPATTGKHKCSTTTDIAEASAEPTLTLYPNPVADVLYLSATARTVRVYNVYGVEVAHATDTDRVDVLHLPAGVYTVRADGTVAKMVKR